MKLRTFLFWPHLIAGVSAGVVILVMCVTGVLLTYERQLIAWADSGFRSNSRAGAAALSVDTLLARVRGSRPDFTPTGITVRADPDAAVAVTGGQQQTLYVDRYSGAVIGEASRGGVRALMTKLRAWHRWLAVEGDDRPLARAITGWSNFVFLFIVASGIYLWFPRKWSWRHIRSVVLFNTRLSGKARDFNWHNVIGSWCAVPLFIVVMSALPISFGWFNTLVYRAVGEVPPPPGGGNARGSAERAPARPDARASRTAEAARRSAGIVALDPHWQRVQAQAEEWRTISVRIPPAPAAPLAFTIDRGDGGQPHLRSTMTIDPRTGDARVEGFADLSLGRRLRNTMRFAHTGEVLGIPGQTVAGVASAGGAVLVWTGLALAWRRFRAWRRRGQRPDDVQVSTAA